MNKTREKWTRAFKNLVQGGGLKKKSNGIKSSPVQTGLVQSGPVWSGGGASRPAGVTVATEARSLNTSKDAESVLLHSRWGSSMFFFFPVPLMCRFFQKTTTKQKTPQQGFQDEPDFQLLPASASASLPVKKVNFFSFLKKKQKKNGFKW